MVSADEIRTAVRSWKPDATIVASEELGGLLHETHAVSLSDRDAVCSFWAPDQSLNDFETEVGLTEYVGDNVDVPTPSILYSDTSMDVVPYRYYLTERVSGDALGDVLGSLSESVIDDVSQQAGDLLGRIHSIDGFDAAGPIRVADAPVAREDLSWQEFVSDEYGPAIEDLSDSRFSDLQAAAREALESGLPTDCPTQLVLLHGDYTPANLVVRDGRIRAVIDFEQATSGHPAFELASAELHLMDRAALFPDPPIQGEGRRRERRELFRDGYRTTATLEPEWEDRIDFFKLLTVIGVMATFEWRAAQHDVSPTKRDEQERQLRRSFRDFAPGIG